MKISAIICTYNPNPDFLKRTVDSVLAQNLNRNLWEFFIIDNNSKQPVANLDFIVSDNIEVVFEANQGLTAARGRGVQHAKGDLLIFVDDDNILEPNYFSEAANLFERYPTLGIVSGHIVPEYQSQPPKWFLEFENIVAIRRLNDSKDLYTSEGVLYNENFPIGAGMGIRKNIIYDYYNKHLTTENYIEGRKGGDLSSGEDIDLDFYAISLGYEIGVSPKLRSIHIIPEFRTEVNYVLKLNKAAIKSSSLLNLKWKNVFGVEVIQMLNIPLWKLRLGILIFGTFSLLDVKYKIKQKSFKEFLKYK